MSRTDQTDWSYGPHCHIERMWEWVSGMAEAPIRVHAISWRNAARLLEDADHLLSRRAHALAEWRGPAARIFHHQLADARHRAEQWRRVAADNAATLELIANEIGVARDQLGLLYERYAAQPGAGDAGPATDRARQEFHEEAVAITRRLAEAYVQGAHSGLGTGPEFSRAAASGGAARDDLPGFRAVDEPAPPGSWFHAANDEARTEPTAPVMSPTTGAVPMSMVPSGGSLPAPVAAAPAVASISGNLPTPGLGGYLAGLNAPMASVPAASPTPPVAPGLGAPPPSPAPVTPAGPFGALARPAQPPAGRPAGGLAGRGTPAPATNPRPGQLPAHRPVPSPRGAAPVDLPGRLRAVAPARPAAGSPTAGSPAAAPAGRPTAPSIPPGAAPGTSPGTSAESPWPILKFRRGPLTGEPPPPPTPHGPPVAPAEPAPGRDEGEPR